jgi:hypothetical protein
LEKAQAGGVLKLDKSLMPALVAAARKRAYARLAGVGGKITAQQAIGAATEGVQEVLQEEAQIETARLHGEKLTPEEYATRLGTAFAGGTAVGGLMKTAHTGTRGASKLATELRRADLQDTIAAVNAQTVGPFVPPVSDTTSAGAEAPFKYRMRVEGELGAEVPVDNKVESDNTGVDKAAVPERSQIPASEDVSTQSPAPASTVIPGEEGRKY